MQIGNRVALVTGAGSGLGLATAQRLAGLGARVVAVDLRQERLSTLQESLGSEALLTVAADVSDAGQVERAVASALERFSRLDIAVNCAGVADAAKTVSRGAVFPTETWNRVIGVNLTGTFNVARYAALAMSRNEPGEDAERGVIVNTASGAATQGQMGQVAYSASKAGVIGMTLPMARDLASHGIRVVAIAPGLFATDMVAGLPQEVSQSIVDRMILFPVRMGHASEFARLVQSIIENAYLNATTIDLDAGVRIANR
jgi:NAD(P)-dependent dehydrogenase (short-subunit alcohol dehydrogenase family)